MSAYIVSSNKTLAGIVNFTSKNVTGKPFEVYWEKTLHEFDLSTKTGLVRFANVLLDENVRSVDYRYKEENERNPFKPVDLVEHDGNISIGQFGKLLTCLEYQSCETSDWESTLAFKIIQDLKDLALRKLPEYEDAEWGF